MKSLINTAVLAGVCACLTIGAAASAAETEKKVEFLPGDVKYTSNPASPAQSAVLYGDPSKEGLYVLRVRIPANTRLPVHTHPDQVRIVSILSGTLYFGYGEKFEESKLIAYGPGSFYKEPIGAAHYSWTKEGEVICDVIGVGPSTTNLVKQAAN
ncbi:MAG: cupin domain-containing protein [Pseudomonadota bacterium]